MKLMWRRGQWWHPWEPPRWLYSVAYHAPPWRWIGLYIRAAEWLLWQAWNRSRPFMWALEDRAMALDRELNVQVDRAAGRGQPQQPEGGYHQ